MRIPSGFFRWKVEKEGFETREAADSGSSGSRRFQLDEEGSVPPGMVHVPEGAVFPYSVMARLEPLQIEDFFIDRYEVTNRRFKEFIDAGGYRDPKYWTKEKISFDAAYGDERMADYLFLPKNGNPPFQTVVYFPGANALGLRSSRNLVGMSIVTFLVRSGRAVLYPIYKSTYERGDGLNQVVERPTMTAWRDHVVFWIKDLARSIDYLEMRQDIDTSRLAYFGASWGADTGAVCLALETRIKAAVLALGGFLHLEDLRTIPEADQINFAPRITVPVLMLNGRYDSLSPVESRQLPMFRFLGTPDEHKRHIIYETGHFLPLNEVIKETLNWLDRYLGPIGD